LVAIPSIIDIIVVNRHIETKTAPIAIGFAPCLDNRNTIRPIKTINISQRNHALANIRGIFLFILTRDNTISKNAPLGQRFLHQNINLNTDSVKRLAIIVITKNPSNG